MLKIPISSSDHIAGDANAPVVLVEYGDYECPHCGHAYPIVQQVQKHFGKKLAFVFRNFPLKELHPHAYVAAETAEFAATKDKFWEMHDGIFENQAELGMPMLIALCNAMNLPEDDYRTAIRDHLFLQRVKSDFIGGARSGVNGTPTFFINGARHDAAFELPDLVAAIDAVLQAKS